MTQSQNSAIPSANHAASDRTVKTALDCDVLTLASTTKANAKAASRATRVQNDPLDTHYRPLGNRDVQSVLNQR